MKIKLDDIPKRQPLKGPPKDYFENLPLQIQGKVDSKKRFSWDFPALGWKISLGLVPVLIVTFYFFILPQGPLNADEILAEIPESELLAYMDQIELDVSDLTENFEEELSESIYELDSFEQLDLDTESLDEVLIEYELDTEYM